MLTWAIVALTKTGIFDDIGSAGLAFFFPIAIVGDVGIVAIIAWALTR